MRTTPVLAGLAAAVLATAAPAVAAPTAELVNRSLFDATPERTAAVFRLDGPTAGPPGGTMTVEATAADGSLPASPGECEPARVDAVVTLAPGEVLAVDTAGEVCTHPFGGQLQVVAGFRNRHLEYTGTAHQRARLVGDGLLSAAEHPFGGQASFSASIRWHDAAR